MSCSRRRSRALLGTGLAVALLAAAGCGASTAKAGGTKNVKVTAVQFGSSLPFQQQEAAGMRDAATALGATMSFAGTPLPDGTAQVSAMEQVTATQPDGILAQPLVPAQFTRPIKDAQDHRIQVLQYQVPLAADSPITTFVGPDDIALGREAGKAVVDAVTKAKGKDTRGNILTSECIPGITQLDYRLKGFTEEIRSGLPNVTIAKPIISANDPTTSYSILKPAVDSATDLVSVYSPCETDTEALSKIHAEEHASWFAVGHDIDTVTVEGVRTGDILGLYPMSAYAHGYLAAYVLITALQSGKPMPKGWIPEPSIVLDSSTVGADGAALTDTSKMAVFWKPAIDKILAQPDYGVRPLADAAR